MQINPPHWEDDMLVVEPLELQFANPEHNEKQQKLSCSVELSNDCLKKREELCSLRFIKIGVVLN